MSTPGAHAGAPDHGGVGLGSALTDLMTSLAVIFVLLLVASLNNAQQEARDLRAEVRGRLARAFAEESAPELRQLAVQEDARDPLGLVVVVPEDLLRFPFGGARVPDAGQAFVQAFTPVLVGAVCDAGVRPSIGSIVVEGHTDQVGSDDVNLELSQRRSLAVVGEILAALRSTLLQARAPGGYECVLGLLAASGRGRREPLAGAAAGEGDSARNRRVVFKIRVKSMEERALARAVAGL